MDYERVLLLYGYKAFLYALLRSRIACPVCGSRPRPDPVFWKHWKNPDFLGGVRFHCRFCNAIIDAELRGRLWFEIRWVPRSDGARRRFYLSTAVLRLHDSGQLPLKYLEVSQEEGMVREVVPPPPPGFLARLGRFLGGV
jgi:hypothetical protein